MSAVGQAQSFSTPAFPQYRTRQRTLSRSLVPEATLVAGELELDASAAGVVSRSPEEIVRVLTVLAARGEPLRSNLSGDALVFSSKLLFVDPRRAYILIEASANEAANEALLARPRASFRAMTGNAHVEFATAEPRRVEHAGRSMIRLRFPDVMATKQRRTHERLSVQPPVALHFLADADGVMSFDGSVVDISAGGLGFVQYASNITLEPGTILKGCRIDLPGRAAVSVDIEVRYSYPVTLPDGRQALRSGCRFVDASPEIKLLLTAFFKR